MLEKSWQIYVAAGFSLRRKCSIIGRAVHADGDHGLAYMTVILMQRNDRIILKYDILPYMDFINISLNNRYFAKDLR
jgi:hypothetical protein